MLARSAKDTLYQWFSRRPTGLQRASTAAQAAGPTIGVGSNQQSKGPEQCSVHHPLGLRKAH
jgi:hypothetical protein